MVPVPTTPFRPFAALQRFARREKPAAERCEICGVELASEHAHLLEPENRRLICSCPACACLFPNEPGLKYRRIPADVRALADFQLTDRQWNELLIPINMAFFFFSSPGQRVIAMYPSPAGATESLLELEAWNEIARGHPALKTMEPDVESLLVNRIGLVHGRAAEYYLAPIDRCYRLVGLIRAHWRGLSGGSEVWRVIGSFFDELKGAARCSS